MWVLLTYAMHLGFTVQEYPLLMWREVLSALPQKEKKKTSGLQNFGGGFGLSFSTMKLNYKCWLSSVVGMATSKRVGYLKIVFHTS